MLHGCAISNSQPADASAGLQLPWGGPAITVKEQTNRYLAGI